MITPRTGFWGMLVAGMFLMAAIGCSGDGAAAPTLPSDGITPQQNLAADNNLPATGTGNHEIWGRYFLVINEETMTAEVIPDRTTEAHYNVTWVKDICPTCVTVKLKNVDLALRTFWIELHTKNPSNKIGRDVRVIIDLDGTGEYNLLDPDDYTRLHDAEGLPNPFRAIFKTVPERMFPPAANSVDMLTLYISESHTPITNIPFIIDASWPGRCFEPYQTSDIKVQGEFPPGGGGSVTVDVTVWDTQLDHGEVWLRTSGIFSTDDILMTPGTAVAPDGKKYSATFANTLGGGSGLTPILIEAYTADIGVEPFPLNNYAVIYADPGGESAIAGDVFNAVNKQPVNGSVVTITNTGAGGSPAPITVTDGTYYQTVLAGTYKVSTYHNSYFLQDTIYDVNVPADTVVYVCFGLAPKYLDDADEAMATISGHIRDESTGDPIPGAQATLDGGPSVGGVIQARMADEHGHYCFYAVPTFQQNNWTVHAFHPDYLPDDLENIPSQKDKSTPQVDFDLTPVSGPVVWREDFETGPSNIGTQKDWFFDTVVTEGWPGDGTTTYHGMHRDGSDILWRVWDPITTPVQNNFYVSGICQLPPDDTSAGWMPDPYEGHRYLWYGEETDATPGGAATHSGSFIDEWDGGSGQGGNSSNGYNAGWAKSGPINLTGHTELTLTLQTYWEVEAVDPSILFDAMDILISTDGNAWNRLDRLNPLAEPIPDSGNYAKAYTSSGFDQAAIWAPFVKDISSYGGNANVWIRLDFDTRDPLYNGFRSWIVDNIVIYPYATD